MFVKLCKLVEKEIDNYMYNYVNDNFINNNNLYYLNMNFDTSKFCYIEIIFMVWLN